MRAAGVVRVCALDASVARRKVEELGCLVVEAHCVNAGEYDFSVTLPGASANALAYAVAGQRGLFFRPLEGVNEK